MKLKGVCYDVGRVMFGDWRKNYDPGTVRRELEIIRDDLGCNAVRICGRDIERLTTTSHDALRLGLDVWLSPELWNKSPGRTLRYTATAAEAAERLHRRWPGRLVMSLGTELTLFMRGIIKGRTFMQRVHNALTTDLVKSGRHNTPLNDYLGQATEAVRHVFHGPITYASLPFEQVDWRGFDFVGVDHYRTTRTKDRYAQMLTPLLGQGKPVVITECGCCTYQGAEDAGGRAWAIVDTRSSALHKVPLLGRLVQPHLNGRYVRDEELQAREITDQLRIVDDMGVDGAFVYTFVFPNNPYSDNPVNDLDMASYSLVKSYDQGRRGATYPDMTWEPKEAFEAVARYFRET